MQRLQQAWWQPAPSLLGWLLWPLEQVYRGLIAARRLAFRRGWMQHGRAPVPVVVVGNLIVGGAGKTPTVIALVNALQAAGRRPGVISRGYRAAVSTPREVRALADPAAIGDEPLLMHRRTGVPVWVGERRLAVARALCAAHPDVDVIVSDDGLQHLALERDAELLLFDARGAGNGRLLPAGPLREPLPHALPDSMRVLYNAAAPSTALPGELIERGLGDAVPIDVWSRGDTVRARALAAFAGQPLHAAAGIAVPERFFAMLRSAGLQITAWPLADHFDFATRPWPEDSIDVLVTEKDAVKLMHRPSGAARLWVVPLDFTLPAPLLRWVLDRLTPRHES